jgi:hypothetical protein
LRKTKEKKRSVKSSFSFLSLEIIRLCAQILCERE